LPHHVSARVEVADFYGISGVHGEKESLTYPL
jgi:hypothetical protein